MTLPREKKNAVLSARAFLLALLDPKKTPRIPRNIRRQAYYLLKHYPGEQEWMMVIKKYPKLFGDH